MIINRTIERVRRASTWILNPTCLIDRFLEQLEKLSVVLMVPAQDAGLAHSKVRVEARLDDPFG